MAGGSGKKTGVQGRFAWRLSRRAFVSSSAAGLALFALPWLPKSAASQEIRQGFSHPIPASFTKVMSKGMVQCQLCPRNCEVKDGDRGECGVRENRKGLYYSLVYGNPCAVHVDPVEKKPFFHVLPGSRSFSIATAGCNLHCKFCQNWEISQARPEKTYNFDLPPEKVVAGAKEAGCPSIAYTYVEPIIFYEYMTAVARLAKDAGILNTCHSSGYINPEPLEKLAEVLDAAVVDLKAFDPKFYKEMVDGKLEPVLNTLKTLRRKEVHVEIVNLVIPQFNDNPQTISDMCAWINDELGPLTPLHFSRFYPLYKMQNHFPTPVATLEKARELALKAGLKYVYLGNIPGNPAESTHCHGCGKLLIERTGYRIGELHLKGDNCGYCGVKIPGIWQKPA
ncbi:MAG: AmmeMemoRadiSam system radical SAM enzyme [Deltaproteobacteria bacterium]|nr:AmmeMemoRadiSam system radical SAM enzyme [Deltaproteobacteria bacterium]